MGSVLKAMAVVGVLLGTPFAQAGGSGAPSAQVRAHTVAYRCDAGTSISVTYLNLGRSGPSFAVLHWNSEQYGLAPAISASGARYAALAGPQDARGGLEWWEHQGEGTLSTFVEGTLKTRTLLIGCKASG